ncbi:MAG: glycine--tRNA ligase subunit beta [Neisseriaceae bacterium]
MEKRSLLIELQTEELPPQFLQNLGCSFAKFIFDGLRQANLCSKQAIYRSFTTPRRLAVWISEVQEKQADQEKSKKGPAVAIGLVEGNPSKALEGFLRANAITLEDLTVGRDGNREFYYYRWVEKGASLTEKLQLILEEAVKKLPISKLMRWGDQKHSFVRPLHGLVVLWGKSIVPIQLFGLFAGRQVESHRFLGSERNFLLSDADSYESALDDHWVQADFDKRRVSIQTQLTLCSLELGANYLASNDLLDEVTNLVEWPVVLTGEFDSEFLKLPPECLVLTMQRNQKFFPVVNTRQELMPFFLIVSNIVSEDPKQVISGNERVLRARLYDAAFFYKVDQKIPLDQRLVQLKGVIYQHKLGTQYQRTERLVELAGYIAAKLNIDIKQARRAAQLSKSDLVTEMVGEFPELQGIMGKYYALQMQEPLLIAEAIEQHYWPKGAEGELPNTKLAKSVALADKLECLVGIWGIGLIPTGDKDPYALRRAALGLVRLLLEQPLDLKCLLEYTFRLFPAGILDPSTVTQVESFILARLAVYLQNQYDQDVIMALLHRQPTQLYKLPSQLAALKKFKGLPEASSLLEMNKRVQNLLKKRLSKKNQVDTTLFILKEETNLYQKLQEVNQKIRKALADGDELAALIALLELKPELECFFNRVLVMADEPKIRENRLNLLQELAEGLNAIADLARLDSN